MLQARAPRGADERNRLTPEQLGRALREALPQTRLHCVSIHDGEGDALWMSEGMFGPDEHNAALEAMGTLGLEPGRSYLDLSLGDGRSAAVFPVRSPEGGLLGVAMVIADSKAVDNGQGARLQTPEVRAVLQRLAGVLRIDAPRGAALPPSPAPVPVSVSVPAASAPAVSVPAAPAPAVTGATMAVLDFAAVEQDATVMISHGALEEHTVLLSRDALAALRKQAPVAAPDEAPRPVALPAIPESADDHAATTLYVPQAAVRDVTLHVQQLLKLRSGGRTRRYEVLLRSRSEPDAEHMNEAAARILASQGHTSTMDRYIVGELLTWLANHREAWDNEPASFSINVAASTMADARFLPYVENTIQEADIPPDIIGFELPERAIIADRRAAEAFVGQCEQIGCFVVLDDFSLHSESVPLLVSSAVKLAKIDARLSAGAMKDKLSQAIVVAISQAAKVLGVNCVAKRVDAPVVRQWLAAIGIDFAQGFLLEKPQPLEALAAAKVSRTHSVAARARRET